MKDDEQRHFDWNTIKLKEKRNFRHTISTSFEVFKTFVQFAALQTEQIMSDVDNETKIKLKVQKELLFVFSSLSSPDQI